MSEQANGSNLRDAIKFLDEFFAGSAQRNFAVRLWEGTLWRGNPAAEPEVVLALKQPGALRQIFSAGNDLGPGEAYIKGAFEIEGDIHRAFDLAEFVIRQPRGFAKKLHLRYLLSKLPPPAPEPEAGKRTELIGAKHSLRRDRQAIRYHYDVPTEFYKLWLDSNLVYSCAYFADEREDIDTAQRRKLDYLCRKLRLRPGERLLDIGCGWGGLLMHAATNYGVKAVGITLSQSQASYARERLRQAGLENRCRVEVCDYRELRPDQPFDKIVSVGMVEHVGARNMPVYFRRAFEMLAPGGVFLNHGIARDHRKHHRPGFVEKYVFPDGELFPLSNTLEKAEDSGFELRDAENLREHYALTLRAWSRRLAAQKERALQLVGERTYRIWRIYIAGAAHEFQQGRLHLFQRLLSKPAAGKSGLPLTRADWYAPEPAMRKSA